jgi:hypothetical protein
MVKIEVLGTSCVKMQEPTEERGEGGPRVGHSGGDH